MAKTIPTTLLPAREGDYLMITTSSGYWGKGQTIKEAKVALKTAGQYRAPKGWRVHSIHPDTYVDDMGRILTKQGHQPIVIAEFDEI